MKHLIPFTYLISYVLGFYEGNSNIVNLDPINFNEQVLDSDKIWVVEFYAPWCPYCQNYVKEYEKVASALKGIAKVGCVDTEEHHSLSKKYSIKILPTVLIFSKDKSNPEVSASREATSIINSVLTTATGRSKRKNNGNFQKNEKKQN